MPVLLLRLSLHRNQEEPVQHKRSAQRPSPVRKQRLDPAGGFELDIISASPVLSHFSPLILAQGFTGVFCYAKS